MGCLLAGSRRAGVTPNWGGDLGDPFPSPSGNQRQFRRTSAITPLECELNSPDRVFFQLHPPSSLAGKRRKLPIFTHHVVLLPAGRYLLFNTTSIYAILFVMHVLSVLPALAVAACLASAAAMP